jgi:hypothetical protein
VTVSGDCDLFLEAGNDVTAIKVRYNPITSRAPVGIGQINRRAKLCEFSHKSAADRIEAQLT